MTMTNNTNKKLDGNFFVCTNDIFTLELKPLSKLLYMYLKSLPNLWEIHVGKIALILQSSERAIRNSLKELKEAELLKYEQIKENGKFLKAHYTLCDFVATKLETNAESKAELETFSIENKIEKDIMQNTKNSQPLPLVKKPHSEKVQSIINKYK